MTCGRLALMVFMALWDAWCRESAALRGPARTNEGRGEARREREIFMTGAATPLVARLACQRESERFMERLLFGVCASVPRQRAFGSGAILKHGMRCGGVGQSTGVVRLASTF